MPVSVQQSLFDYTDRQDLGFGAWIEARSGWLDDEVAGAGTEFDELRAAIPWRAERRQMYDRVLDVPRLVSTCDLTVDAPPHPIVARLRRRLNVIYAGELGEPFVTAGFCLYRDGSDSVAWHGDTIGRGRSEDTMVAIVSLGATRMFAMRPRGGSDSRPRSGLRLPPSLRLPQSHGDLLVMGGSCQRTWEHSVPKTAAPTGPRISIQFRPRGVR